MGRSGDFYDQDATGETAHLDSSLEVRRQRMLERQREREIELRREAAFERERQERRRRARDAQRPQGADAPLRISSRPGDPAARAGVVRPEPVTERQPQPTARALNRSTQPAPATPTRPAPPISTRPPPAPPAIRTPRARGDRGPTGIKPSSTGRATAILAAGTLASRLTGFLRVLTIAYVLGVNSLGDAFNYANGVPNIVYDLLLGGVLSATLIPVFVDQFRHDDQDDTNRGISAVLSAIAVALVVITGLLWLLAPWVIRFYLLLYPKSAGTAERSLATTLLRYFAPQVFLLGAIVVSTALLNARRRFTAAGLSPVLNNLVAIGALLATKAIAGHILTSKTSSPATTLRNFSHDEHAVWILGIGTTVGYLIQLLAQLPAMRGAGFRLRLVWDLHHPAVRRVAHLSTWLVGVVIANQVSLALVMILAGKVSGGVTAYQFSYQFFQLPYALIAVSVASALMPDLSERWSRRDKKGFQRQAVVGLRVTLALLVPVALAYVAVAQPFIQLAVHHGRVTQSGAHLVGSTLALFAVGLPGFSAFFLLMRMYQAMQSPKAMFGIYAMENLLTVIFALILDPLLGVPGLALAWAGPYTIASIIAVYDLRKRVGSLGGKYTAWALFRILLAGGIAGAVVAAVGVPFPHGGGDAGLIARLVVQLGVGAAVYVILASLIGIRELRPVARLMRRLALGR